jgi:hypothetical protein
MLAYLLRGLSPQANYADRATAACRRIWWIEKIYSSYLVSNPRPCDMQNSGLRTTLPRAFYLAPHTGYNHNDQVKDSELGGASGAQGWEDEDVQGFW